MSEPYQPARRWGSVGLALFFGAAGGWLFQALSLPLPWILGSIFGVVLATRFAILPLARPPRILLNPVRATLGFAIGSTFQPAILDQLGQYAISLIFLLPFVAITGLFGWIYFRHLFGFDSRTAFLSAMPGGIAELIILGEEMGADIRRVALIHGMRVIVLVYTLPFLAGYLTGVDMGDRGQIMPLFGDTAWLSMLKMVLVGGAGWFGFHLLGISGASLIGAMIFAAAAAMTGLVERGPPNEILNVAQLILGTSVGAVFVGYGSGQMARIVLMGLGQLVILAVAVAAIVVAVTALTDFTPVSAILAFAPGGQAETGLIAMALNEDVGYVATHHLVRLIVIMSIIPMIFRFIYRRS